MIHKKLYITSTLPYINGSPHIGHLFEFIICDAISHFYKKELGNNNVLFNTGLDEHGLKVLEAANKAGITPGEHVEVLTKEWMLFCDKFKIKYDNFYKTSSIEHHTAVKRFWIDCQKRGDIYKKPYEGKYCTGCESFKTNSEILNNKCVEHQYLELKDVEEENYFFRLSKYKENLFQWIGANTDFISPKSKLNELKNLILDLEDISISRLKKNVPWGIEVPGDSEQIVYIWFDALTNYLFSCGYKEDDYEFNKWWDNTIQVCGPDNLKFQAVIFQALLTSAGIKKTGKLLVHGTILDKDGNKMSKSAGNVIDPIDQLNKFGLDAVRLYALSGINTYSNSQWSERELIELYNTKLANGFGNLIARTLHLIDTRSADTTCAGSEPFRVFINKQALEVKKMWAEHKIKEAILLTNEMIDEGNRYFNDSKPWETQNRNFNDELSDIYYLLKQVTELYYPILPHRYEEIKKCIETKKKVVLFPRIEISNTITA